jgi:proline iminopeptidase
MMKKLLLAFLFTISLFANGQKLYIKTYGNKKEKVLIFIHGGPSQAETPLYLKAQRPKN